MEKRAKIFLLFFTLLLICFSVSAGDSPKEFFPSLASASIYPSDKDLGLLYSRNSSAEHEFLYLVLQEPYSFDWTESYVASESKKIITSIYSNLLSELLPAQSFLFSRPHRNADNSASIAVKFTETGNIVTFVVLENKIISLSVSKK